MGSRLGVVIHDDGGFELYYDHWAAQTIGIDVALDGCEATVRRVRDMEPMGVDSPHAWEGASWIEGSLLIDFVNRRLVWAEESEAIYLPRIVNHLIECTWPGWTALWAAEGVRGILRLLDVDTAGIFKAPTEIEPHSEAPLVVPWADYEGDDAISVSLATGDLVRWRGSVYLGDVASRPPEELSCVAEEALARSVRGESVLWDQQRRERSPEVGIHVDFTARTLCWWGLADDDAGVEGFDALWQGWDIRTLGDNYEFHERLITRKLRDWSTDREQMRRFVEAAVGRGPRQNPVLGIASALRKQGQTIAVMPTAMTSEPSKMSSSETVLTALDVLSRTVPLTPARYVDRLGKIHEPVAGIIGT